MPAGLTIERALVPIGLFGRMSRELPLKLVALLLLATGTSPIARASGQ